MGRIPSLLPLEVKHADNGSRPDRPRTLASEAGRRASYATSAGDRSTSGCSSFPRDLPEELRPPARSGSFTNGLRRFSGLDPHHLLAPLRKPSGDCDSPPTAAQDITSALLPLATSDVSTASKSSSSATYGAHTHANAMANSSTSSSSSGSSSCLISGPGLALRSGSYTSSSHSSSHRLAPSPLPYPDILTPPRASNSDPSTTPAGTAGTTGAHTLLPTPAPPPPPCLPFSGAGPVSPASVVLSRFSHRALTVQLPPGGSSPSSSDLQTGPGSPCTKPSAALSGAALARAALSTCLSAELQLQELVGGRASAPNSPSAAVAASTLTPGIGNGGLHALPTPPQGAPLSRRQLLPAGPATAAAALLTLPTPPRLQRPAYPGSACASPVSLPTASAGGSSGMSRSLAALLDHRSALPASHPSAVRPASRGEDPAVAAEQQELTMGGGDGAVDGGTGGSASSTGTGDGAGETGGKVGGRSLAQLLHSMLPTAPEAPQGPHRSNREGSHGQAAPRRAGVAWAAGPHPATAAAGSGGGGGSSSSSVSAPLLHVLAPCVTACAMRAVSELQTLDEYSLVAAARQRQLLTQRTLSRHSLPIRQRRPRQGGLGGGGSVGRSHLLARMSGADTPDGFSQPGDPPLPLSFSSLMDSRLSCPDLGYPPKEDAAPGVERGPSGGEPARPAGAADSNTGAGLRVGAGDSEGEDGADSGVAAASTSVGGGGGVGGGSTSASGFLPALPSPNGALSSTASGRSFTGMSTTSTTSTLGGAASGRSLTGPGIGGVGRRGRDGRASGSNAPVRQTMSEAGAGPGGGGGAGSGEHVGPGGGGMTGDLEEVAEAEAAAREAEVALAAVRALAARYGTMDPPDLRGGEIGEPDAITRERRRKMHEALAAANPVAYQEEAAAEAEAAYRALAEQAQLRLRRLQEEATTQEGPVRQLEEALRELTSNRPFFLPPVITKTRVERSVVELAQKAAKPAWSIDESLFAQRKKESESHDLYDTDKIRSQQLSLDWRRVVGKSRFRRMVARGDMGVKVDGQSLEEELAEVREELQRQGGFIRSAFIYYSMLSGGTAATSSDVLQISLSGWLAFCNDAGIIGPKSLCTAMDMQNIFVAVNFEEESETAEADANDDDAMVRFEFMEGLVRVAFCKYIQTKRMTDASDAVGAVLEEVTSSPTMPLEATTDPNEFRRNRFYSSEVEEVIAEYYDLLTGMFKLYKARDRSKYLWPEHFVAFLESNSLLGPATGLHRRDAKLVFGWSQALVTDELRRRQRAVSLTFWDFVEAVARIADFVSPPETEAMLQFFQAAGEEPPELDRLVYEYFKAVGEAGFVLRRTFRSSPLSAAERPLAPKLRLMLEYLTTSLRDAWGGGDVKEVAAKVLRTANYLSGGIEMG